MDPYRKKSKGNISQVLSTEQVLNNLSIKIHDLEKMLNQHPNIMLQLKMNKLSVHVDKLEQQVKSFHKYKIYKYLFYIFLTFYALKWASNN